MLLYLRVVSADLFSATSPIITNNHIVLWNVYLLVLAHFINLMFRSFHAIVLGYTSISLSPSGFDSCRLIRIQKQRQCYVST